MIKKHFAYQPDHNYILYLLSYIVFNVWGDLFEFGQIKTGENHIAISCKQR